MKQLLIAMVLVAFAAPVFAKPKEQVFTASCNQVWSAVKIATAPPHYNFAQLDDAQKKGIVSTGDTIVASDTWTSP